MKVSTLFGLPLFAWGGVTLLILTVIQMLIGYRKLNLNFKYHRIIGWLILLGGIIHGILALDYLL